MPVARVPERSDSKARARRPFLTARWESLILLNYICPADLLSTLVPDGTELDEWRGYHWISLVGFMFRDTRLLGVPVPLHREFEEVNLRFYVRRVADGSVRRAVVFIRELVPRRSIAFVARAAYNEPYLAVPMDHTVRLDASTGGSVEYAWRFRTRRFTMRGTASGPALPLAAGGDAEFMTEHYWGYTRQRDGRTLEYRVDHPKWDAWDADEAGFEGEATGLYGPAFAKILSRPPDSAHIAVGSDVAVYPGTRLNATGAAD